MYSYSNRLSWSLSSNQYSQLIQAKRQTGSSLLDLASSNPTSALLNYPHREISKILGQIHNFNYEPHPAGANTARSAVCEYYSQSHRVKVSPDRVVLTASTSEAYSLLFKLFCDPGDEVLIPIPSYPLFEYLAALDSVRTVPYSLRYDGSWFIDCDYLTDRINSRTRAAVIVSPNNPTGSFLKESELKRLERLNLPLVSDEVFSDYPLSEAGGRVVTLAGSDRSLSFSLNGLSKIAGMPQMKLGWIVVNGPQAEAAAAIHKLELILDTYLSVGTPVQQALPRLLEIGAAIRQQIQERIQRNLQQARAILAGTPAHCLHTEAGWSAIIRLPRTLENELLEDHHVIVQPGYFFDIAQGSTVVVSLLTPPSMFQEGLERLKKALDS